ncbi:armadillo-type protein [Lipomyces oligophaga]|uniref:armadillo-type protein n=1 Tax=Lipomyces oligophaga TaxID=45792 RepID=UPI0034CDD1AD
MEEQLEQAVEIALNSNADYNLKQQAISFCNQIKDSPNGWQICIALFVSQPKRSTSVRFFALQVVDDALVKRLNGNEDLLDHNALNYIKGVLLSYLQREFNPQITGDSDAPYMENKLSQTVTYLFALTYLQSWPSFYDDILALSSIDGPLLSNSRGLLFFLRVLNSQHEEIADTLIRRSEGTAQRGIALKDAIRARDMTKLTNIWREILLRWGSREDGLVINESCLKVIGSWISWIDISLIVTPEYMNIIFSSLGNEPLRKSACDTLTEIVSKKMKPVDKLQLISLFNLPEVISQLPVGRDLEFDEKVARLSNAVSLDLVKIQDDQTNTGVRETASHLCQQILPFSISFLGNEYDDTASEVFPAISEYLSFLRKEKKRNNFLTPDRLALLTSILKTVVLKLKYDETMDFQNGSDESEAEFLEIRSRLRLFQDAIAAIDVDLFMDTVSGVVLDSLDGTKRDWREIELGLYELNAFIDGLRNASAMPSKSNPATKAVEILNTMLLKMISSNILSLNHPAINLFYLELIVKPTKFLDSNPQLIPQILNTFVSAVGIHSSFLHVQLRSWFLFYRFIKLNKLLIGDISETALTAISDLLVITAEIPQSNDNDSDVSTDSGSSNFEGRLYLFEVSGLLISIDAVSDEKQLVLLKNILNPIFADMERNLPRALEDPLSALQVHHDIMALGTFARGVADGGKTVNEQVREQFLLAGRAILVTLETLSRLDIVREASRFAFARMVPILEYHILPEIPTLVSRLLVESSTSELIDFMSFLGQLVHNFKDQPGMFDMVNSLLGPLLTRIYYSLSISANGSTDEEIRQTDMKKAYLSFMLNLLNNGMGSVLVSRDNRQMLDSVIQSVAHYSSTTDDSSIKKMGSSIFPRLEEIRSRAL